MNAKKDIGQLIMIGLEGPALTARERRFLRRVQPAGLTYFRRNVESPRQLAALSRSIWKESDVAPLIAIDQEGGKVLRLGPPFTQWPAAASYGMTYKRFQDFDLLRRQIKAQCIELRSIGVNYNFVPVADVQSNPKNPVIGNRSFGTSPQLVARLVEETVRMYRDQRIVSCAKHFPGHGDTFSDSHKRLPTVNASASTLNRREIPPFRAAIRAGVPTIMTAHVIYSAWDRRHPATLSPKIVTGLLRRRLKFKGVCVSDDLEMAAISARHALADAALEAIQVGVDLLLVCKSLDEAGEIHERLVRALESEEVSRDRVREAFSRVAKLKRTYLSKANPRSLPSRFLKKWAMHRSLAENILSYS